MRSSPFAPNVKDENGSDKYQAHYQHGDRSDFDSWRIVRVESPHSSTTGAGTGRTSATTSGAATSGRSAGATLPDRTGWSSSSSSGTFRASHRFDT